MDDDDYDPRDDPDFQEMMGELGDNDFEQDYSVFQEAEYDDRGNWDIGVDLRRDQINARVYNAGGTKFFGECFSVQSLKRLLGFVSSGGRLRVSLSVDNSGQISHFRIGTSVDKVILRCLE